MFNKVHHVTYVVPSIDQMAAYLEKYFGLKPIGIAVPPTPEGSLEPPAWGWKSLLYKIGDTLMDFTEPLVDERGEAIVKREPAMMFAKMLRETGPGLFHVAWGVDDIDKIFGDLKGRGLKFTQGEHGSAVHESVVGGYRVLNIDPREVGPTFANATSGCFFQVAEGEVVSMPGWRPTTK
jgi:catechol 2,3-dioxygenase-like lactoylglutathione lyase family enzyme